LEREVVEAVCGEQRRIGQDMRDSVAQELTAAGFESRVFGG
jgi:signal transduction histidine kinase